MLIGKESISQYAPYSVFTDFQPITQRYKQKNRMKSSSAINPAITENAKLLIIKTWTSIKIVGVSLDGGVLLSFVSSYFEHLW